MPSKDGKIRILAISGGGIRGVIPATLLAFIEKQTGKRIWELFDIIGGTSTGGLLAAALTKPMPLTAVEALNLYVRRGKEIFSRSQWRAIKMGNKSLGPKYDGLGLKRVLEDTFAGTPIESALTPTFLTAYRIARLIGEGEDERNFALTKGRGPVFFKSWANAQNPQAACRPLVDVCLATSAGPTYFPPVRIGNAVYIDGGTIDNNPAISSLTEGCMHYGVNVRDCVVLALGCGHEEQSIDPQKAANWGDLGWIQPLLSVTMDGVADLTHYQMLDLMPDKQYLYVQPDLDSATSSMDLATSDNIARLMQAAQKQIDCQREALLAICEQL